MRLQIMIDGPLHSRTSCWPFRSLKIQQCTANSTAIAPFPPFCLFSIKRELPCDRHCHHFFLGHDHRYHTFGLESILKGSWILSASTLLLIAILDVDHVHFLLPKSYIYSRINLIFVALKTVKSEHGLRGKWSRKIVYYVQRCRGDIKAKEVGKNRQKRKKQEYSYMNRI